MEQELVVNDALKWYQTAFIINKGEKGIKKCIEDIFGVELNSYCNILSGNTTGCFASEELHKTFLTTMNILRGKMTIFYEEFLNKVKKEDMHFTHEEQEENTLKSFIEYLITSSRKEFDIVLLKNEMKLVK